MAITRRTDAPPPSGPEPAGGQQQEETGLAAMRKATWRLIPILGIGYGLAFMDRASVSYAALGMNQELHFSETIYGFGAGLFFIGNAIAEVPSNLLLLRYGAKRIMAAIIFFWGIVATTMMLVRTPMEYYSLRLLLGLAEAGFYPGVIYYLTLWFPSRMRARAVSRFYIALPLSSVVMGSLAGWLMGLHGHLGLSGWQWLFLVEGLPAIFFAPVILWLLPDGPEKVHWLSGEEKDWIKSKLHADAAHAHLGHEAGVVKALLSSRVWSIGLFFFFIGFCIYGFTLSAPSIIKSATHWSVSEVGWAIALFSLLGAVAMLLNGIHSDRGHERLYHCVLPCIIMAAGYLAGSSAHQPWLIVASLAASIVAFYALWGPALSVPMEFLAGRAAAAGIAAMNTIAIFSGFFGPLWMGRMKDVYHNYNVGLRGLAVTALLSAVILYAVIRSLNRRTS